jgi:hypothetical protein
MFINLSLALINNDVRFRHQQQQHVKRLSRDLEQNRHIRHIMGKLIDTDTNTIYNIEGQKQMSPLSMHLDVNDESVGTDMSNPHYEDLACLEACYKCVEDYPVLAVSIVLSTVDDR